MRRLLPEAKGSPRTEPLCARQGTEDSARCARACRLHSHDDVARRRLQKWTVTAAEGTHTAFELPDRVNNLFAIILLLVMEWSLYLHVERHDWAGAAALRRHPRPRNCRNLPISNLGCERKSQCRASSMQQTTASVHSVAVATGWGAHSVGFSDARTDR